MQYTEPILIIDAKRRTNLLKYSRDLIFITCKAEIHFLVFMLKELECIIYM